MQKAVIIIIIAIFVLSTIGFYIAALGVQPERETEREVEPEGTATSETMDADFDIPDYVLQDGVDFRGALDAIEQDEVVVELGDRYFEPTVVRINPGTTVIWTNDSDMEHSLLPDPDSPLTGPEIGSLAPGERHEFTFEEAGVYEYFCEQHPASMRAAVKVVE